MKKMYVFFTILFTGILLFPLSASAQGEDCTIRNSSDYVAGTGFSLGASQVEGDWTPAGFVLADQFQINLEYQDGVDPEGVDLWNDWGDVAGLGANPDFNWHDPQNYVLSIDVDGGLNASQYTGDSNNPLNDFSENLQWTITGWDHTILGGYIEEGRLVVSPANTYRPFDPALNVNVQENFSGFTQTELTALTFTGDVADIDEGTVFGVELLNSLGAESTWYADGDGDGLGDANDSQFVCAQPAGYVSNSSDAQPNCETNDEDCNGDCGGDAVADNCGTCDSDASNDCTEDCSGVWGGDAVADNCDNCDNDPSNDCVQDCAGVFGGDAVVDVIGVCDGGCTADADNDGVCDDVDDCDGTIRDDANYVVGTGFSLGVGNVIADQFQINLEYQAGVDPAAIDVWNDWAGVIGEGTGVNWHDPENYVISIDVSGALGAGTYGADPQWDYSEGLEWTMTGWGHTVLGGYIDGNQLVVSGGYRPFPWDEFVNVQEVFDGNMDTELIALTFTGNAEDIGDGTVFGVELLDTSGASTWYADTDGDGLGDANDSQFVCAQPAGYVSNSSDAQPNCETNDEDCNGDCGGNVVLDECGVCDGDNSTCLDCANVVNGTSTTDDCGVCDDDNTNDNTTCLDCANVVNGTSTTDDCGVCDDDNTNDNSTCTDCCGVVNGDGTTCDGVCGPCNDDTSCLGCTDLDACNTTYLSDCPFSDGTWTNLNAGGVGGGPMLEGSSNEGAANSWSFSGATWASTTLNEDGTTTAVYTGGTLISSCYNEEVVVSTNYEADEMDMPIGSISFTISDLDGVELFSSDGVLAVVNLTDMTITGTISGDDDIATVDDNSCVYADDACESCVDDEVVLSDADGDGVCDADEVVGCQDSIACNFDPLATDPGACEGEIGCTLVWMFNYDADSDCIGNLMYTDNSLCVEWIQGCMDETACNYNADANGDDNSCWYPTESYLDCDNNCINDLDGDDICDEIEVEGCTNPDACNYNINATNDDGTCVDEENPCDTCEDGVVVDNDADDDGVCDSDEIEGCQDASFCNYDSNATDAGECVGVVGCMNPASFNFNPDADCFDDSICTDWVMGCMDALACNYNENANFDDFSCVYPGCTDPIACNYDSEAACDDGSCSMPGCDIEWSFNFNPDADCIDNSTCVDWLPGCMDELACNFNTDANVDDDSCWYPTESYLDCDNNCINDLDGDDICDEVDNCLDVSNPDQEDFDNDGVGDGCDGVSVDENTLGYNVYPNPADNLLIIECLSNEFNSIRIINPIGSVVYSEIFMNKSTYQLDISRYPAGLYNIIFTNNKNSVSQKLIVQ